jgi:hypothetical protein
MEVAAWALSWNWGNPASDSFHRSPERFGCYDKSTLLDIVALIAGALLAACANPGPSSFAPSSAEAPSREVDQGKTGGSMSAISTARRSGSGSRLHCGHKNPQLLLRITDGTGRPIALWVDTKNNLWVANETDKDPESVTEFRPGASSAFLTITNFYRQSGSVAVGEGRRLRQAPLPLGRTHSLRDTVAFGAGYYRRVFKRPVRSSPAVRVLKLVCRLIRPRKSASAPRSRPRPRSRGLRSDIKADQQ